MCRGSACMCMCDTIKLIARGKKFLSDVANLIKMLSS